MKEMATKASKIKKISRTHIERRMQTKQNPELRETIITLKKAGGKWPKIAKQLAKPRRKNSAVSLFRLSSVSETSKGKTIIVPGKVIGNKLTKKLNIAAFQFSNQTEQAIKKAGGKILNLKEAVKLPASSIEIWEK